MSDAKWYANWVRMLPAESAAEKARNLEAADLIESLAAELEQVKQERDGLNILLGQAQSMLETRTRERDTAIAIAAGTPSCETCAHYMPGYFCPGCRNKSNWQWRGVKEN